MWPSSSDGDDDGSRRGLPFSTPWGGGADSSPGSWLDNAFWQVQNMFAERDEWLRPLNELGAALQGDALVAYRAPSARQYDRCLSGGGRSVWTEDGAWRCLFKGQSPPAHLQREFPDLTGFLDYQRGMLQKQRAADEARRSAALQQLQQQQQPQQPPQDAPDALDAPALGAFPGSDRPRLISEAEAQGKQPVWQSESSEAITLDDGSTQTRTKLVKYFDDGTALCKQSTDSGADKPGKTWFWK